jgi:glycosyltransferase involved in cell wall biosynthesis
MTSQSLIPVSTILLTKNSVETLPAYLASMNCVDDIIVLDGGSTDGTLELLARHSQVRVFPQDPKYLDEKGYIIDFSGMRNSGYALARHRWILCIDADESADPKLLEEVAQIVAKNEPAVYYCPRQFVLNGQLVVQFLKVTTDHLRLFHLDAVNGCIKPVHERLDIKPGAKIGYLHTGVLVPLPAANRVRPKYDRYLAIECRWRGKLAWGKWWRWMFFRNLRSIIGQFLIWLLSYTIPKKGPRYPLALVYEQIRYVWLLTWYTCPIRLLRA